MTEFFEFDDFMRNEDEINETMGEINGYQKQNDNALSACYEVNSSIMSDPEEVIDSEAVEYHVGANEMWFTMQTNLTDQLSFRV